MKFLPYNSLLGSNPVVATDATCFMPWIVQQYGLKLPKDFKTKDSCIHGTGDKSDINKDICWYKHVSKIQNISLSDAFRTKRGTKCDFNKALLYKNGTIQRNLTQGFGQR